jgi:hypothetical protein
MHKSKQAQHNHFLSQLGALSFISCFPFPLLTVPLQKVDFSTSFSGVSFQSDHKKDK